MNKAFIIDYPDAKPYLMNCTEEFRELTTAAFELALCGFGASEIFEGLEHFHYLFNDGGRFWEQDFKSARNEVITSVLPSVRSAGITMDARDVDDCYFNDNGDFTVDPIGGHRVVVYYRT